MAFTVRRPTGALADGVPIFSDVLLNAGGGYNQRTGVFTCPVSGLYLMLTSILSNHKGANRNVYCNLMQNNNRMVHVPAHHVKYVSASVPVFLNLAAGDVVKWSCGSWDHVYEGDSTVFSGTLIHVA